VIVVDANLIAYLLISGDYTAQARGALRKQPEWVAPRLWRSEFRNVLATYMRRGELPLADAIRFMDEAEFLMQRGTFEIESSRVLKLAACSGLSAYDCEFVALAQELRAPLVTTDRQVLTGFPETAVALGQFGA
jgi:predicted nucleic acid-binding protein